jgi:plasmid stabilization system protein ParE
LKKYRVLLHPDAELHITSSFKWGCRAWGNDKAELWVRNLPDTLNTQLSSMPLSYPLASESEELGVPVRHLIVGRYRVLFVVKEETVTVLHVRGSFIPRT